MAKRRAVSPVETSVGISLIAILLLGAIGIGVLAFLRGPYYERALSERAAAEGKAAEGGEELPSVIRESPQPAGPPFVMAVGDENLPILPPQIPGLGWKRSEIETYTADNLFEKIDGRDQAYLAFDVVGLTFASYENPSSEDDIVDLYIYDMAKPLNALGIYSAERAGDEEAVAIGDAGYRDESSVFFRKGRFYVQSMGSAPGEAIYAAARALAAKAAEIAPPADSGEAVSFDFLPAEGRVAASEGYTLRDGFGIDGLEHLFFALYGDPASPAMLFAANCGTEEKAREMEAKYEKYVGAGAEKHPPVLIAGVPCRLLEREESVGGVFIRGTVFAGVEEARDEERARARLAALIASIAKGVPRPAGSGGKAPGGGGDAY